MTDLSGIPESRRCPDCGREKPLDQFPRNKNCRDGRHTYCKRCHNLRVRESRMRLHGGSRHYHLTRRYGIRAVDVDDLIQRQGGLCALCLERTATQVDHDHRTGKVRAILCLRCNAALGKARDDVEILRRARNYLLRHGGPSSVSEGSAPYASKVCSRCRVEKSLDEFVLQRAAPSGRHSYCKPCFAEAARESRARRHGGSRQYLLKHRYVVDPTDVDRLLSTQGGICAICRNAHAEHVDHDHSTGKLRGLLCFNCNALLGYADDDPAWFEEAIAYLECHRGQASGVREGSVPYIIHAA